MQSPNLHPTSTQLSRQVSRSSFVSEADLEPDEKGVRAYVPPTLLALWDHNMGLCFIAMSQFFFACMSTSVKFLMETTGMSTVTLIFVRMGITGLFCIAALLIQRDPHPFLGPPGVRKWLVLRGLAGFCGLFTAYQALRGLSVSDAVTIGFLTPSVTALLGFLLLHESFGFKEAVAGVCSLTGVVLISRPPFIFGHGWDGVDNTPPVDDFVSGSRVHGSQTASITEPTSSERVIGVTWALSGVIFSASAYLTIRFIGKRANALHSIGYFSAMCTFVCGMVMVVTPSAREMPKDWYGFALILLIGVFGFAAQALLTFGLQREKAGRAGLAMYLQIIFAVILDLLVFRKVPSFLSFCGTAIILSSAMWIAMQSLKTSPPHKTDDPESAPLSRTPSPSPEPGAKTLRGELYSYAAIPTDDDTPQYGRRGSTASSTTLQVPRPRKASSSVGSSTPNYVAGSATPSIKDEGE